MSRFCKSCDSTIPQCCYESAQNGEVGAAKFLNQQILELRDQRAALTEQLEKAQKEMARLNAIIRQSDINANTPEDRSQEAAHYNWLDDQNQTLIEELEAAKRERDNAHECLGHAAKLVYLGGLDTPEAVVQMFQNLRAELAQMKKERDLAIAHDRQSYPTADAYEKVCAAHEAAKRERDNYKALAERLVGAMDDIKRHAHAHAVATSKQKGLHYEPAAFQCLSELAGKALSLDAEPLLAEAKAKDAVIEAAKQVEAQASLEQADLSYTLTKDIQYMGKTLAALDRARKE